MFNSIVCRYHEIAIKGHNRKNFEQQLMGNIQHKLCDMENLRVKSIRGRIWIEHGGRVPFTAEELSIISGRLRFMFGMENFSPALLVKSELETIRTALRDVAPEIFDPWFARGRGVDFRIRARRSDKTFPMNSNAIEIELATVIGDLYPTPDLRVHLDDDADITVGCEVRDEFTMLFFETIPAGGGLPTGSNSPVLALLSGGIDSPVACLMTMKRGSEVDFISFHSDPYTPPETVEKILGIGRYLNTFQRPGTHYFANIAAIQKLIRDNCNPRFRTVLYRRMMFRIAERVARAGRCKALLTGEALGQVASQTIENMTSINAATSLLVLRPLVGMDKLESIRLAQKFGTYEKSIVQVPDSCTVFMPQAPATRSEIAELEEEEAKLGAWRAVLDEIVAAVETR